jgi:aminoglycoside phosphotransferase (APT) family kinase protein
MSEAIIDTRSYTARLETDFPDIDIASVEIIGTGWDHTALDVNDSLIFRIPRGVYRPEKLSGSVIRETNVLKHLQGQLPVTIPNPCYIAPADAYFGYPKLAGANLMDLWADFDHRDRDQVREDWVSIAAAIHQGLPQETARKLGAVVFSGSVRNASKIFDTHGVNEKELAFADRILQAVGALAIQSLCTTFIHNDLQLHNLIADPATRRVTGVIDWTDACIGPVEREFAVWECTHDDQLERVATHYENETGIKINQGQASMWRHLEQINDFVEQSAAGDVKGADKSLNHIRQWIAEGK